MATRQDSWAVVGGGILGLTLALRLAQMGRTVTIYEASPQLGGRWGAATFTLPQAHGPSPKTLAWSKAPYSIMAADTQTIALLDELGFGTGLDWAPASVAMRDGTLTYPLDDAFDLARLPFLGVSDRVRLALGLLAASHREEARTLHGLSIENWLGRLSSERARERFWHPILRAKLGDGYADASAALLWNQLCRQRASRSAARALGAIGSLAGTATALIERFERTLASKGVTFRKASPVRSITSASGGLIVETQHRRDVFDNAVMTLPGAEAAKIAPGLSEAERTDYGRIAYQARLMPMLLLRAPLQAPTETFFTDENAAFPLVINGTSPGGNGDVGGHGLIYMPRLSRSDDALFEASDADVRSAAVRQVLGAFGTLEARDVLGFRIDRIRHALPLPRPGDTEQLPRIVTSVRGLHVVNGSHALNGALDLDGVIALANRMVSVLVPHEVSRAPGDTTPPAAEAPAEASSLRDAAE